MPGAVRPHGERLHAGRGTRRPCRQRQPLPQQPAAVAGEAASRRRRAVAVINERPRSRSNLGASRVHGPEAAAVGSHSRLVCSWRRWLADWREFGRNIPPGFCVPVPHGSPCPTGTCPLLNNRSSLGLSVAHSARLPRLQRAVQSGPAGCLWGFKLGPSMMGQEPGQGALLFGGR